VKLAELPTPALLIDVARMHANIRDMAAAAADAGIALRPHFKTSKCVPVVRAQLAAGAVGFAAATAAEVSALREAGVAEILWAHQPVGPVKVSCAVTSGATVGIDSVEVAGPLSAAAQRAGATVPYLIEVDTGLGRTGVPPSAVVELAKALARLPGLQLRGAFTHEGHLGRYPGDRSKVESAGRDAGSALVAAAQALRAAGYRCDTVSVGSTPGATSAPFVPGVTEARPGTYVFYDANQVALGSATLERCALTVLARVVTVRHDGVAIIDAGVKAMSSDMSVAGNGFGIAGQGLEFAAANEEHGYLQGPGAARLRVGDLLRIVPNHACGTVNMFSGAYAVEGDQAVERWPIVARH
jgi:D-serine deaminase-like pyridoxal phosphate-dependent protein